MGKPTTRILVSYDGGFSSIKCQAMDVSAVTSPVNLHSDGVWTCKDRSVFAPIPDDVTGVFVATSSDGVSGIIGEDAILMQPTLWQSDSTEDHYGSSAHKLFVRTMIAKFLSSIHAPVEHSVELWLSLSLPGMHGQYAEPLRQQFMTPFDVNGYNVIPKSIEVQKQPFWILIDYLSQWDKNSGNLLPFNTAPLMGSDSIVVIDFGSLTFQGGAYIRNLTPRKSWCEPVGSWEQIKSELKSILLRKAAAVGLKLYDPNMQELLSAYETGHFRRGKHDIDLRDEIGDMVEPKIQQRLRIAEQQLRGAGTVGDMLLAGGDVEMNHMAFKAEYEDKIGGSIVVMDDFVWRVASGGLKGAIRQFMRAMGGA